MHVPETFMAYYHPFHSYFTSILIVAQTYVVNANSIKSFSS